MPDVVLQVSALTAGYGGPPIVQDVTLEARAGAVTALVGPNGAGKSTLLKAIAGVIQSTSGRVVINGTDVSGLPPEKLVRHGLAYVPQVA
ncbi:MAG: branched-chain amino acid transport system ATP-binding protein, partial [Chloroflexota bacterium]|nr:branched-chain amino acid transport system ATP-binding protein [Chloroflexota bacterium]